MKTWSLRAKRSNLINRRSFALIHEIATSAFGRLAMTVLVSLLLLPACKPTYKKETLLKSVQEMSKKEVGSDVDVAQAGRTLGLRFRVPNLVGELSSGNEELYRKMNSLFIVLVRVSLSSDEPPRFVVLDIVDEDRPQFHLIFTRYVEDIRRSMAEAISYPDLQDRLLEEIVVGQRRVAFDPMEMDLVRLVMMSTEGAAKDAKLEPYAVEDIDFKTFVGKVTENKARRILRERKDTKDDWMLRDVQAGFDAQAAKPGTFKILLDLVSSGGPTPPLPLAEKVLPAIAKEAGALFHSYRFKDISLIEVAEKNSGKAISVPAPQR